MAYPRRSPVISFTNFFSPYYVFFSIKSALRTNTHSSKITIQSEQCSDNTKNPGSLSLQKRKDPWRPSLIDYSFCFSPCVQCSSFKVYPTVSHLQHSIIHSCRKSYAHFKNSPKLQLPKLWKTFDNLSYPDLSDSELNTPPKQECPL